jgi:hypothetical protein
VVGRWGEYEECVDALSCNFGAEWSGKDKREKGEKLMTNDK